METHNLDIPYKTVRYHLGAKPKAPRPSHIRKNEEEVRGFKESLPKVVSEITSNTDLSVKIFSYNETRPGLITPPEKESLSPESDLSDKYK